MKLTWMSLSLLLLPALAVITSRKFSRMPSYHVNASLSQTVHKNVGSRIQCTAICRLANCLSVDYNDDTCTVHTETVRISEGGSSYIAQGAVDQMLSIPKNPYEELEGMRYIAFNSSNVKASEGDAICASIFSFGKRFMVMEETDVALANAKYVKFFGNDENKLWLGLTDLTEEGVARWDDGRDFVEFSYWTWKSGDGSNDEDKDYVFINVLKDEEGWEAEYKKADDSEDGVICEVTIPSELLPWPCN